MHASLRSQLHPWAAPGFDHLWQVTRCRHFMFCHVAWTGDASCSRRWFACGLGTEAAVAGAALDRRMRVGIEIGNSCCWRWRLTSQAKHCSRRAPLFLYRKNKWLHASCDTGW